MNNKMETITYSDHFGVILGLIPRYLVLVVWGTSARSLKNDIAII